MPTTARLVRLSCTGALALACTAGIVAPVVASADTPSAPIITSASGTPGVTLSARWVNSAPGTATMHVAIIQPANSCRPAGDCPTGYPDWQGDVTLTGLAADGLTVTGSGSATCTQVTADEAVCHWAYLNNYLKTDNIYFSVAPGADETSPVSADLTVGGNQPTSKADCKGGNWANWWTPALDASTGNVTLQPTFRNQGDCVSSVVANPHSGK